MADDVEIPTELAAVYRAWWTAHADVVAYEAAVTAQRLQEFPNPDGKWNEEAALKRQQWKQEQVAELEQLRHLRDDAFRAMTAHPLAVAAREAKTWKAVSTTLQQQMLAAQEQPKS